MTEIRHFSPEEFRCRCGCGESRMDRDFVEWLDALREKYGKPIRITSGYRCPEHNQAVSHTGPDGPHTTGRAVDVGVSHADAYRLLKLALNRGCPRVGVNQAGDGRFLHLDFADGPAPRVWSY